jgi:hypothetical protein
MVFIAALVILGLIFAWCVAKSAYNIFKGIGMVNRVNIVDRVVELIGWVIRFIVDTY